MSSRFSAARPKRAGENYARQHHGATDQNDVDAAESSKKVKFDVRNPSALAHDTQDDDPDDAFLQADADVIRGSAATKRGAVNIDGYDSDSDREELGAGRAERESGGSKKKKKEGEDDDDDMDDMFAAEDDKDDAEDDDARNDDAVDNTTGKRSKEVRFLDSADIVGQVDGSRSGGSIGNINPGAAGKGDGADESDDEEAVALAIQEEDVDEEVGLGGLKRHAPKVEAFNLSAEQEEGRFDEAGNFVRRAVDPEAVHDRWLDGVSRRDVRRAAEAHEKRAERERERRRRDDSLLTPDLLRALIVRLERGETALEALARLGRDQARLRAKSGKPAKPVPKWKQKKLAAAAAQKQKAQGMEVDEAAADEKEAAEDPNSREEARIKEAIDAITDAADTLLGRDRPDVYDRTRELLTREYAREADEPWTEPTGGGGGNRDDDDDSDIGLLPADDSDDEDASASRKPAAAAATAADPDQPGGMWEFRWTDGRDDTAKQGPYDARTMRAWRDAGYFADGIGVEFRPAGSGDDVPWARKVEFV